MGTVIIMCIYREQVFEFESDSAVQAARQARQSPPLVILRRLLLNHIRPRIKVSANQLGTSLRFHCSSVLHHLAGRVALRRAGHSVLDVGEATKALRCRGP